MARRNEEYARLNPGGGYTQALTVGKGFSGAERSAAKQSAGNKGSSCSSRIGSRSGGTMNAFAQHQELIRNYHRYHLNAKVPSSGAIEAKGLPGQRRLTDEEALQRQHRFVRDHNEDSRAQQARGLEGAEADPTAWEVRMAAKYYKLLFKEYALADLSRYREDKVGLRWRTEKDVVSGKGQFECGALRCQERKDLHSYELNFKYKEAGAVKNELVKVRVCPQCARKLFRKKIEALRRQRKAEAQMKEQESEADSDGERRRKRGKSSTPSPSGSASATPDGDADDRHRIKFRETSAGEGHDLIRQAVAAAGDTQTGAKKRNRPSRWGDRLDSSERTAAAAGAGGGDSGRLAAEAGGGAMAGDDASRKAWAGELERDRTAEDEMDDYLSSLLL